MTATLSTRTVQQKSVEATRRLREVLGLDDLKLLSVALAEVAAEDASRDPAYAERIRQAYRDLVQMQATRPLRAKPTGRGPNLVPIASLEEVKFDPFAPPDPYMLLKLYGPDQLRAALGIYTLAKLKQALVRVEQRNPQEKPVSRARKDAVIDFIVAHVAGTGY